MRATLAVPYVAAGAGFLLGVGMVAVSRLSSRLVTPEDPARGFAVVALLSLLRLGVVAAALAGWFLLARAAFLPFALTLLAAFLGALAYEAVVLTRPLSSGPSS